MDFSADQFEQATQDYLAKVKPMLENPVGQIVIPLCMVRMIAFFLRDEGLPLKDLSRDFKIVAGLLREMGEDRAAARVN